MFSLPLSVLVNIYAAYFLLDIHAQASERMTVPARPRPYIEDTEKEKQPRVEMKSMYVLRKLALRWI